MKTATERKIGPTNPEPFKFTEGKVRDLKKRATRYEVRDTEQPRLILRVTPSGAKSYSVLIRNRITGKPERHTIGSTENVTVEQARIKAGRLVSDVADSKDPAGEKRAARAKAKAQNSDTIEALVETYIAKKSLRGRGPTTNTLSPSTIHIYRTELPVLLGDYYRAPLSKLSADILVDLHAARTPFSYVGAGLAVHALAAVCKYHKLPSPCGRIYDENLIPATPVRPSRLEVSDVADLAAWLHAQIEDPETSDAVRVHHRMFMMALLTGLRAGSLTQITWDMLTLTGHRPRMDLPALIMKGKRPAPLPLPPTLVSWLAAWKKTSGSEFVFGQPTNPDKAIDPGSDDWANRLPIECSLHDARKVFAKVLMEQTPAKETQAKYLMHHAEKDITFTKYAPASCESTRAVSAAAEEFILSKLGDRNAIKNGNAISAERHEAFKVKKRVRNNAWMRANVYGK